MVAKELKEREGLLNRTVQGVVGGCREFPFDAPSTAPHVSP
jgi:hypothetical protein